MSDFDVDFVPSSNVVVIQLVKIYLLATDIVLPNSSPRANKYNPANGIAEP